MHCKYLPVVPYKALENFSKALYGTTGGTYSACIIRPVMSFKWAGFHAQQSLTQASHLIFMKTVVSGMDRQSEGN